MAVNDNVIPLPRTSEAARDQGWNHDPPEPEPAWVTALRPTELECEVGRNGVADVRESLRRAKERA